MCTEAEMRTEPGLVGETRARKRGTGKHQKINNRRYCRTVDSRQPPVRTAQKLSPPVSLLAPPYRVGHISVHLSHHFRSCIFYFVTHLFCYAVLNDIYTVLVCILNVFSTSKQNWQFFAFIKNISSVPHILCCFVF